MKEQPVTSTEIPPGLQGDTPEAEFTNQLIAEAVEYIHEKNIDGVVKLLTESKDTADTMGALAYKVTKGLIDKHKKAGMAMDIEFNVAMGLATEVIDMELEILDKIQKDPLYDPQRLREDALMHAIVMYGEKHQDDPEAKEASQTMLRAMMMDGTTDQAFSYVNKRAAQEGVNINDMKRQGMGMLEQSGPQKNPVAEGVQRGLMGGE